MYAADTILVLKEQRDPDPETGETFAYNRVQVIGQSPISHSRKGTWTGSDAEGVILTPIANFGGTLDEPFGKCRLLYDVESIPVKEIPAPQSIRVINANTSEAGETPEEVFKREAPGVKPLAGETRGRSPLGGDGGPVSTYGPLGEAEGDAEPPEEELLAANLDDNDGSPL